MKRLLAVAITGLLLSPKAFSQNSEIRPPAIGISFTLHDFETAQRIRSNSLSSVLRNKQWSDLNQMSPGIAVTYFRGLNSYVDFAGTLSGSFVDYPLLNKPTGSGDNFLLEADASLNLKMFTDKYWFTPYITVGVGASKYKGYYGAFIPVGGGLKVNIFDEAAFFITSQYRLPVTNETSSHHFMNSFGFAGVIGGGKKK